MDPVSLTGFLLIPGAERALLLPLLDEHIRLTHEEPGCLSFRVTETEPGRFAVTERFRDRAAFDAHQARAAASPWGAASRHLVREYTITGGA